MEAQKKLFWSKAFLGFCLWLGISTGFAQTFPENPDDFITHIQTFLTNTNNDRAVLVAENFSSVWGSISLERQTRIIQICKAISKRGGKPSQEFASFFSALASGISQNSLNEDQFDNLLYATEEMLKMYQGNVLTHYFQRIDSFFGSQAIFYSPTNRMYLIGGTYSIDFITTDMADAENGLLADTTGLQTEIPYEWRGAVFRFNGVDVMMASTFDSLQLRSTSGVYLMAQDIFIGNGGNVDWANIYVFNKVKNDLGEMVLEVKKEYEDFAEGTATCDVYTYLVQAPRGRIRSNTATLVYGPYFNGSAHGKLEHISIQRRGSKANPIADYPKFESFDEVHLDNLGDKVFYQGGFTLQGRQGFGTPSGKKWGTFGAKRAGEQDIFNVRSKKFAINDSTVTCDNSKFSIYLGGGKDSIYHTSVDMIYKKQTSEIEMIRSKFGTRKHTPFINTHHKYYIDADIMRYNLGVDSLDMYMNTITDSLLSVNFESFGFFDLERFETLAGTYGFHPIKLLDRYKKGRDTTAFSVRELASYYQKSENEIRGMALDLMRIGYADYDETNDMVIVTPRTLHAVKAENFQLTAENVNAENLEEYREGLPVYPEHLRYRNATDQVRYNEYDYDDIFIRSFAGKDKRPNASMNLYQNELIIRGIDSFAVSKNLNVFIRPKGTKEIHVFEGIQGGHIYMPASQVDVGNITFVGKEFFLNYDDFVLDMPLIENMFFIVRDSTGQPRRDSTGQVMRYGEEIKFGDAGTMSINDHNNKSGLKQGTVSSYEAGSLVEHEGDFYASYPKVDIPEGGYVNFNTPIRAGNSYDSSRVQFRMPTIKLDSLYLKDPVFPGIFNSNIFHPFNEKLIGLPDGTMGFIHSPTTPTYTLYPDLSIASAEAGRELAPEEATIYPAESPVKGAVLDFKGNKLFMNKKGLFCRGEISYLTTTINTDYRYLFTPDYVSADTVSFVTKEGPAGEGSFPEAFGADNKMLWYAQLDSLLLNNSGPLENLLPDENYEENYKKMLITLYGSTTPVAFKGTAIIQKEGFYGDGQAIRRDFEIFSLDSQKPIIFEPAQIESQAVEFKIYSVERDPYNPDPSFYNSNPPLLQGNYVDVIFDLITGSAFAQANEAVRGVDYIAFEYPFAQYKTNIQTATYDAQRKQISMQGDETSVFSETKFGAGSYDQRDLSFKGTEAYYDINNLVLEIKGVPEVRSADASIIPDSNKVRILAGANMDTLHNARLIIDTLGRYHNLTDGTIKINNRIEFSGDATYRFVNVNSDTFKIKFNDFVLAREDTLRDVQSLKYQAVKDSKEKKNELLSDNELTESQKEKLAKKQALDAQKEEERQASQRNKTDDGGKGKKDKNLISADDLRKRMLLTDRFVTVATGPVDEKDNFYITTNILFKGDVIMYGNKKNLSVNGYIKMDLRSGKGFDSWIPYRRSASDALLDIPEKFEVDNQIITSGLHFSTNSYEPYASFFSPKRNKADDDVFLASGEVSVDDRTKEFTIIPLDKRMGRTITGNKLTFNDRDGIIEFTGKFNFFNKPYSDYLQMAGDAEISNNDQIYLFNALMMCKFPIPSKSGVTMASSIAAQNSDKVNLDLKLDKTSALTQRIGEVIGEKDIKKYFDNKKAGKITEASSDLAQSFVLSSVDLTYNAEFNAYYSTGKLKLFSVFDKILNIEVPGFVEIRKNPSEAGFTVYFESGSDWYYFDITKNILSMGSSNTAIMAGIKETKNPKEDEISIKLAGIAEKEIFTSKYEAFYGSLPPVKIKKADEKIIEDDKIKPKKDDKKKDEDDK